MSTKSKLIRKLRKRKDYREAFVASQISAGIPFQIRALRKQFNWSQKNLAEATQMLQPRICAMEQAGYGDFTLNTLKKLASAFDVGLLVRFAPFGELINWADNFSPDTYSVPSSKDDPVLYQRESGAELRVMPSELSGNTSQLSQGISPLFREATNEGKYTPPTRSLRENDAPLLGGAAMAAIGLRANG